jgi:NADH-quinone oxidoreductase subunit G
MIEIEIDGKPLQAPQGAMIIEVADANNIRIPRFCYHKKLSVAANCRMCLVEVEKMPKTVPACATPVTPGMKIFTESQKARDSQRAVMEFLLINHPLDCPICDQGGECELQDNALSYGNDNSPYRETKRVVKDEDIGSLVATELTRCIQCTRCVRFGQEIAGLRELGMVQRGEHSEIRTFMKQALKSEVSANVIDLCPVGALTSKPFRFTARAWELNQHPGIAAHDAFGSHIYLHTRRDELMRVIPKDNENINECWLSDRDRFSYLGVNSAERLLSPMIKRNGQWHATDWETALLFASKSLNQVKQKYGNNAILGLSSPNTTLEEYYLFAKLMQVLDSQDLTYHVRDTDLRDAALLPEPHFGISIADIEEQKAIFVLGSLLAAELPLMSLRMRKAILGGACIDVINPFNYDFNFSLTSETVCTPQQFAQELASIIKVLLKDTPNQALADLAIVKNAQPKAYHEAIANRLKQEEKSFIYLGALAYHAQDAALLRMLALAIANLTNSQFGMYTDGANSFGLAKIHRALSIPVQASTTLAANSNHKAIMLHQLEPSLDCANPYQMDKLLDQAEMVIALTSFKEPNLLQHADVLFPISTLGETSGTLVNLENKVQNFAGCIPPKGEARPAWKVFRVLGNLLNAEGFDENSTHEVLNKVFENFPDDATLPSLAEIAQQLADAKFQPVDNSNTAHDECYRLTTWPIYRVDNLVRRSDALQTSGAATPAAVWMNEATMKKFQLQEGDKVSIQQSGNTQLNVYLEAGLPDQVVWVPAGFNETSSLGENFGKIVINKI